MTDIKQVIAAVEAKVAPGKSTTEFALVIGAVALALANNLHCFGLNLGAETLITLTGLCSVYIAGRAHVKAAAVAATKAPTTVVVAPVAAPDAPVA